MAKRKSNNQRSRITPAQPASRMKRIFKLPYILIAAFVVVILAIGGVAGWNYSKSQEPYKQIAINYNGTSFDMRYFVNTIKLYYGNAPQGSTVSDLADYAEQQIELNQSIIQGAKALGIEIPRKDVEAELKKMGKAVTDESVDMQMAKDLLDKQVPDSQTQYHILVMLLESESAANAAIARLQAGDNFTSVAIDVSRISPYQIYQGDMGWVTPRLADMDLGSTTFGNMISSAAVGSVSGPVRDDMIGKNFGYWVVRATEIKTDSQNASLSTANVEGILVGSEQEAADVISKLNAGADINELAKQVSQYPPSKDIGAMIGWMTKGEPPATFDKVFDVPVNTVVGPIIDTQLATKGGYWVYDVVEKNDSMTLTSSQYDRLKNEFLTQLSDALQKEPSYKVENLLTQEMKDFALDEAVNAQGKGSVMMAVTSLPNCELGYYYSYAIRLYGQKEGNTWSITKGDLPEGISFDTAKGVIYGTPKNAGASSFTIRVGNNIHYWEQEFTLTIRFAVKINTESLADGKTGEAYSEMLYTADDSYAYTWTVTEGALPEGLTLNKSTGAISGKPGAAGTYNFTVQADDGIGKATKALSITVQ